MRNSYMFLILFKKSNLSYRLVKYEIEASAVFWRNSKSSLSSSDRSEPEPPSRYMIWTSWGGKTRTQRIPTQAISFSLLSLPSAVLSPCGYCQRLLHDYEIKVMSSIKSSQRLWPQSLMCHKMCDKTHSSITGQVLETPRDVSCIAWQGVWALEVIL